MNVVIVVLMLLARAATMIVAVLGLFVLFLALNHYRKGDAPVVVVTGTIAAGTTALFIATMEWTSA